MKDDAWSAKSARKSIAFSVLLRSPAGAAKTFLSRWLSDGLYESVVERQQRDTSALGQMYECPRWAAEDSSFEGPVLEVLHSQRMINGSSCEVCWYS